MSDFLLDTNCFIQIVRSRPNAPQVEALLQALPVSHLFMTDFTLHSIGVIMARFGQVQGYMSFLTGLGVDRGFGVIGIDFARLGHIANTCAGFKLDFDDAYQYVAAEQNNLTLVSLDADFDRTPRGRLTPAAALQRFTDEQQRQQQQP